MAGVGCADADSQETEAFSGLSLIPPNRTVEEGDSFQLAVTRLERGQSDNVTQSTNWTLSDPTIATVSPEGQVTATRPGVSLITAQVDGLTVSTSVYVLGRIDDIQISPTIVRVAKNTTTSLAATVIAKDNTKRAVSSDEVWASDSPRRVTMSGRTAQAGEPGLATITLSTRGRTFTKKVETLNVELASITPGPSAALQLVVGQSRTLSASGQFTGRTSSNEPVEHTQDVSNYVGFAPADEADEAFIKVSGNTVSAVKPGRAVIKVTGQANTVAQGKEAQLTVDVLEAPSSIALAGPDKLALKGEPVTMRVNGTVGTATVNVSSLATLKAEPAGIVYISGTTLTPMKAGEVTLTATVGSKESAKKATMTLSVQDVPSTSVAIGENAGTVAVGQTLKLTSTETFQSDITQDVTRQTLWLSDNPAVAAVDNAGGASGTVTGLSTGSATITAYYRGQYVGSTQIRVP
ncbi:MAG TPA: Ig-like domain-containing protein [Myxococcaceae bacterium]|jgi:hypothetical protein